MGQKIGFGEVSHLVTCKMTGLLGTVMAFLVVSFGGGGSSALAAPTHASRSGTHQIAVQGEYRVEPELLTTEKVWSLDPEQINPHLQTWVVKRSARLMNLKVIPRSKDQFGVTADRMATLVQAYVRGPGPWFQRDIESALEPSPVASPKNSSAPKPVSMYSRFSCNKTPDDWFATREGAEQAASVASEIWFALLRENQVKLSLLFARITASSEVIAQTKGEVAFSLWLATVDQEWRETVQKKVRQTEWAFYLQQAKALNFCNSKSVVTQSLPITRKEMMEQVPSGADSVLLARAPAKLWNGIFTIRASVKAAGQILNGRFLIDSSLNRSVLSPSWLESQGVPAVWVDSQNPIPIVLLGSDLLGGRKLARHAVVDSFEVAGLKLPMNEFALFETQFFSPPENFGNCCDGVLGSDFLRNYPVEFHRGPPLELKIWQKEGFHPSLPTPWIEASQLQSGGVASQCRINHAVDDKKVYRGVKWNTGSQLGLTFHPPWANQASKLVQSQQNDWQIHCDELEVVHETQAQLRQASSGGAPFAELGMATILQAPSVTFDLPHGRLWFSGTLPFDVQFNDNRSGLKLAYTMVRGERILQVVEIQKKSRAQELWKLGLRPKMVITEIDAIPSGEMDLWEVNRRLGGHSGEQVVLQWKASSGLKMAPFRVRDKTPEVRESTPLPHPAALAKPEDTLRIVPRVLNNAAP